MSVIKIKHMSFGYTPSNKTLKTGGQDNERTKY